MLTCTTLVNKKDARGKPAVQMVEGRGSDDSIGRVWPETISLDLGSNLHGRMWRAMVSPDLRSNVRIMVECGPQSHNLEGGVQ